jgi:glycosyltransferase involved in cell wall biosynthesis
MKRAMIDVIIAVYNGEKYIEEAIASVQNQSLADIHIIVADDGSTDQTRSVVLELSKEDDRISLLELPHRGVAATLNAAIAYSSAAYIAFLDADDLWREEKLEKQMQALQTNSGEICFCLLQEFESLNQDEQQTHRARLKPLKGYSKTAFLGKRDLFERFGLFDDTVAIGDFVDWFSRTVRAKLPVIMLEEVLALRRVHQNNTTRTAPKTAFLSLLKTHLDEQRKKA